MTDHAVVPAPAVPLRPLAVGAALAVSLTTLFLVAFDQGAAAAVLRVAAGDGIVHELFHDSRHVLAVPCH